MVIYLLVIHELHVDLALLQSYCRVRIVMITSGYAYKQMWSVFCYISLRHIRCTPCRC